MDFNFKTALELLDYQQTPEGKAEKHLKTIIAILNKYNVATKDISWMTISLIQHPNNYFLQTSYVINSKAYDKNMPLSFQQPIGPDNNEALATFDIIRDHFTKVKIEFKDIPASSGNKAMAILRSIMFECKL